MIIAKAPKAPAPPKAVAPAASENAFKEQVAIAAVNRTSGLVLVGCKLPHGLMLEHPDNPDIKIELKGLNKIAFIGAPYATTMVPADFWSAWMAEHYENKALKSGAIFVGSDMESLTDTSKDFENVKTGFEKMAQNAPGIVKANDDDI